MKKLIMLLAAVIGSLAIKSQTVNNYTISLDSIKPDDVCVCDSTRLGIRLKYTQPLGAANLTVTPLYYRVYDYNAAPPGYVKVNMKIMTLGDFYTAPKKAVYIFDSIYYFKIKVPCDIFEKYPNATNPTNYVIDIGISAPTASASLQALRIRNCTVGVEEYQLDMLKPVYFDLYGNKIEKRGNEVMIEKVGNRRRKIVIQE